MTADPTPRYTRTADLTGARPLTRMGNMYLGEIVERGPAAAVVGEPRHPYTQALIQAVPVADPDAPQTRGSVIGELPNPINLPAGCTFHPRCPFAMDICRSSKPALAESDAGHWVACHLVTPHQHTPGDNRIGQ